MSSSTPSSELVTAELTLIEGESSACHRVVNLYDSNCIIGRSSTCDVIIGSLQISRQHVSFEKVVSKWYIRNTSLNGVTINGSNLVKNELVQMVDYDVIGLGVPSALRYRFKYKNLSNQNAPSTQPEHCRLTTTSSEQLLSESEGDDNECSVSVLVPLLQNSCQSPLDSDSKSSTNKEVDIMDMDDGEIDNCDDLDKLKTCLKSCKFQLSTAKDKINNLIQTSSNFKMEFCDKIVALLESELSCPICGEVLIKATFIDCGHSFCHNCITEWGDKSESCPSCRQKFQTKHRHVAVDNFTAEMFQLLTSDIITERSLLVDERAHL